MQRVKYISWGLSMVKRKMIQSNLIKNLITAYFAAFEIYNKPNIVP